MNTFIKIFTEKYNEIEDLVEKLTFIHNFVYDTFKYNLNEGIILLKNLILNFNDENLHLSEIKTVLVISKPFKNNKEIKKERIKLLETYKKKKNERI